MTSENLPVPAEHGAGLMSFGQTRLDAGDLILPRIKLVQAQSQEVSDGLAQAGQFFNTLTNEVLDNVVFVPIVPFKQRIMLVRGEKRPVINQALKAANLPEISSDFEGLACRSYDMEVGNGTPGIACGDCPLSQWDEQEPPLCSETYNVAGVSEYGDLLVLSFSKSSARQGKQLFSMIRVMPGAQGRLFTMTSKSERGKKGTYFAPVVTPGGPAPTELVRQVRTWASQLEGAVLNVTPEDDEAAAPVGASGEDGNPF